jgi:hypothetical protein
LNFWGISLIIHGNKFILFNAVWLIFVNRTLLLIEPSAAGQSSFIIDYFQQFITQKFSFLVVRMEILHR